MHLQCIDLGSVCFCTASGWPFDLEVVSETLSSYYNFEITISILWHFLDNKLSICLLCAHNVKFMCVFLSMVHYFSILLDSYIFQYLSFLLFVYFFLLCDTQVYTVCIQVYTVCILFSLSANMNEDLMIIFLPLTKAVRPKIWAHFLYFFCVLFIFY